MNPDKFSLQTIDMSTAIPVINITTEVFSLLVMVVLIVSQLASKQQDDKLSRHFLLVLFLHTFLLLFDVCSWLFDNQPGTYFLIFMRIANFMTYSLTAIVFVSFMVYVLALISLDDRYGDIFVKLAIIITVVMHIILIASQFTGAFYTIDDQNHFSWGEYRWVPNVFGVLLLLLVAVAIIKYRKKLGKKYTLTLLTYIFLPALSLGVDALFENLMTAYSAMTLALLIIFVNIHLQQEKLLREQKIQLIESRIAIALSQVQPHFMFNALVAIEQLCKIDAEKAALAMRTFSQYLRTNLNSLNDPTQIEFSEELEHVRHYFWLEQMRFGEKLQIEFDVPDVSFLIPPLTVQPLVENAVKYGISEGGLVVVRVQNKGSFWEIAIIDDGIGFDVEKASTEKDSYGIKNVRSRLALMCNGSLRIQSTPGKGTKAIITIPKRGI